MNCPSSLNCEEVMTKLWEFIDHELTPDAAERMREHLAICSGCFPQYDFQRAFVVFLRRNAATQAPPELRRRIFQRLLSEPAHRRR